MVTKGVDSETVRPSARRGAAATRARLLGAVRTIIEQQGLAAVGINAIARTAGLDKVLIYRQFGSLDGLFAVFADQADLWWQVDELVDGIDPGAVDVRAALKTVLARHADALQRRALARAVLAAEMTVGGPLVAKLQAVRESRAAQLNDWLMARYALPPDRDWPALMLLLGAALNYLAICSATAAMGTVSIASDAGRARLLAAAGAIIDAMLPDPPAPAAAPETPAHG
jgi:AcrR family transcriptional regulator